jgi:hypothetical protein
VHQDAPTTNGGDPNGVAAAAVAGAVAISFFAAAWLIFVFSAAIGVVSPLYGDTGGEPGPLNLFGMYVLAPAVAAFGAALPARSLGAGWGPSLLVAVAFVGAFFWAFFAVQSPTLVGVVLVAGPAAVALVGAAGSGVFDARAPTVLAGAAVFLVVTIVAPEFVEGELKPFLALLPAWIILPALVGRPRPR